VETHREVHMFLHGRDNFGGGIQRAARTTGRLAIAHPLTAKSTSSKN
jgi:hypothetical protein